MLTDAVIKRTRPTGEPFKLADERGLYLYVPASGHPAWRFDYRFNALRKTLSLGIYPDVSLKAARAALRDARALLADGRDPAAEKQAARVLARSGASFAALADEWFGKRKKNLAPKTAMKKRWQLDAFLLPAIGRVALKDLQASAILQVVLKVEAQGHHETARRTLQLAGQILRYGVAHGRVVRDVTTDLRGALVAVESQHHPALTDPAEVGALMRAIGALDPPRMRLALRLLALTFVRPGELRLATWAEFDLGAATWIVPATRTKQRHPHIVPLSRQAIAVLEELRGISRGSRFILPSPRTILRPLSEPAFLIALARAGYEGRHHPHGFRATARTLLDERLQVPADVIEAQLGHVTRGALRDTYNRSRYLVQRATIMQRWADYLDALLVAVRNGDAAA